MVSMNEAKNITVEIAELLKEASTEQKLQIKGILIGANIASYGEKKLREDKPEKEVV